MVIVTAQELKDNRRKEWERWLDMELNSLARSNSCGNDIYYIDIRNTIGYHFIDETITKLQSLGFDISYGWIFGRLKVRW